MLPIKLNPKIQKLETQILLSAPSNLLFFLQILQSDDVHTLKQPCSYAKKPVLKQIVWPKTTIYHNLLHLNIIQLTYTHNRQPSHHILTIHTTNLQLTSHSPCSPHAILTYSLMIVRLKEKVCWRYPSSRWLDD